MERRALEELSRDELVRLAEEHGVARPRVLTKDELVDELVRRTIASPEKRGRARGWLGRARDLLTSMMEGAADARARAPQAAPVGPAPLATVTLAEIYAAQGHFSRAVEVLDQVLAREPSHEEAKRLRARFVEAQQGGPRASEPAAEAAHEAPSEPAPETAEAAHAPSEPTRWAAPAAAPIAHDAATPGATMSEPIDASPPSQPEVDASSAVGVSPAATSSPRPEPAPSEQAAHVEAGPSVGVSPTTAPSEGPDATSAPPATVEDEASRAPERASSAPSAEASAGEDAPLVVEAESPLTPGLVADLDEVVALSVSPERLFVYWEVRAESRDAAKARAPLGELTLRVLTVQASWDGPEPATRDVPIDALVGDRFIGDIPPGAAIRVSVGWRTDDLFDPIAVGAEVRAPRATPSAATSTTVRRWSLHEAGAQPGEPLDAAALHALAQASLASAGPSRLDSAAHGAASPEPSEGAHTTVTRIPAGADTKDLALGQRSTTPSTLGERTITYLRGGASDLVRVETFTPWGAALYGGASELGLGGASELSSRG